MAALARLRGFKDMPFVRNNASGSAFYYLPFLVILLGLIYFFFVVFFPLVVRG